MPASTLGTLKRVLAAVKDVLDAARETLNSIKTNTDYIPANLPHISGRVGFIDDNVARILATMNGPYRSVYESLLAAIAPTYVEHRVGAELAEPSYINIPAAYAIILKPLSAVQEVRVGGPNGPVVYTAGNCVAWWPCAVDQINNAVVLRPGSKYYVVPVEGTTVTFEYIMITVPWLV